MKQRKRNSISIHKLKHEWHERGLSYQFAIIIGILLLAELIFSIFYEPMSHYPSIDDISRTSFSSILGYILGMNIIAFSQKDNSETPNLQHQMEQHSPSSYQKERFLFKRNSCSDYFCKFYLYHLHHYFIFSKPFKSLDLY